MIGIVDRLEEDKVILEVEEELLIFNKNLFPDEIEEGDIVECIENVFRIKKDETKERRKYIEDLFESIIDNGK